MFFACNPRGSLCKQRRESADRLSRSKLTRKPCRLFHAKKKKERTSSSLPIPPPVSRVPSIKLDRSGSLPREANSIRVSCDRGDAKLRDWSWIIDSVACIVKGIEERFEIFQQFFFFIESIDCKISDLEDMPISHILTSNNSRSFNSLEYIVTSLFDELYFRNDRTSIVQFSFNSKRIPRFFLVGIGSSREKEMCICVYIYS